MRTVREAWATSWSQPVATVLTIFIVTGMVVAVLLTTGRTVAVERNVLAVVDDAGTRSIQVRAEDEAGLSSDVLNRLHGISGIEWAVGFSSAKDATNALVPEGIKVPVRYMYSIDAIRIGVSQPTPESGDWIYASSLALDQFGFVDRVGAVTISDGTSAPIARPLSVPDYLSAFEPLSVIPRPVAPPERINVLVVVAADPQSVMAVAETVSSLLAVEDPSKVTVQTSQALADLRASIQYQLSSSSRVLVLGLVAVMAIVVGAILFGLVMMRRKDFGRRRALGATRGFIVMLLLVQTALLALSGSAAGVAAAYIISLSLRLPLPDGEFALALAVATCVAAVAAALVPATVASRREPIRELRVP